MESDGSFGGEAAVTHFIETSYLWRGYGVVIPHQAQASGRHGP